MAAEPRQRGSSHEPAAAPARARSDRSAALCRIAVLLDALQCGAMVMDRNGRIAHANCRLCEMMQRTCSDLVGMTVFDLYSAGPGRALVQDLLDHFDEPREHEFHLPRP